MSYVEIKTKEMFDYESAELDTVFYNYMNIITHTLRQSKVDSREKQPVQPLSIYMKVCHKFCYDCSVVMCLNLFLTKWRDFINNNEDCLHYREYILGKSQQCIRDLNERFSFSKYRFNELCGCTDDLRSSIKEIQWTEYISRNVIDEDYEIQFEKSLSWQNNLGSHMRELNKHLNYFKQVPHKVYRNNILVPLVFKLNNDCVGNIIQYL